MNSDELLSEIRDANLNYLVLAQQMIRADKDAAIFRLGVSADIADLISSLNLSQLIKLANSNMMLTRFRFDDVAILSLLTRHGKEASLAKSHAAIVMTAQPIEDIS